MQLTDAPAKIVLPFANNGDKNVIPVQQGSFGMASYTAGFPPETRVPVNSGGSPPLGKDFNGIYFALSAVLRWINAGAVFPFDANFATAVGGYPTGSRVLRADGLGYWRSLVDNNSTNPDTGGAGWAVDGLKAIASVFASVNQTLSAGTPKVAFDTVEYDSKGLWDSANNRFKALFPGLYRFTGTINILNTLGQNIGVSIWKNGQIAKQGGGFPQVSDTPLAYTFDVLVNMAVNDYAEVFLFVQQSAVTLGPNGSYVFVQCEYIGQP